MNFKVGDKVKCPMIDSPYAIVNGEIVRITSKYIDIIWGDGLKTRNSIEYAQEYFELVNVPTFEDQRCKHINGSTPINGYIICKMCGQNLRKAGF